VKFSTAENTKITLGNTATLWLRKTVTTSTQIEVYGVQVELLSDQSGSKAGTTINIGYARAGIKAR
jgi:hypothetical protein